MAPRLLPNLVVHRVIGTGLKVGRKTERGSRLGESLGSRRMPLMIARAVSATLLCVEVELSICGSVRLTMERSAASGLL